MMSSAVVSSLRRVRMPDGVPGQWLAVNIVASCSSVMGPCCLMASCTRWRMVLAVLGVMVWAAWWLVSGSVVRACGVGQ